MATIRGEIRNESLVVLTFTLHGKEFHGFWTGPKNRRRRKLEYGSIHNIPIILSGHFTTTKVPRSEKTLWEWLVQPTLPCKKPVTYKTHNTNEKLKTQHNQKPLRNFTKHVMRKCRYTIYVEHKIVRFTLIGVLILYVNFVLGFAAKYMEDRTWHVPIPPRALEGETFLKL